MYYSTIVLGSKPVKKYPKVRVKNIVTSNAAAIKKKKFASANHIAICGTLEFSKKKNVKNKVIKSKPNKIIFISGQVSNNDKNLLSKNKIKSTSITNLKQLSFQQNFFKFGFIAILYAEFFYEKKLMDKFIHITKILLGKKKIKGASTGFYSILYSLDHFKGKILTNGFSMQHGNIFYKSHYPVRDGRARVDSVLVRLLKNKYVKRIIISDIEMNRFKIFKFFN